MADYSKWSKDELLKEVKKLKKQKKYGIVWEDRLEQVAELCKEKLPVLVEVKDKEIETDDSKPVNILIEGDNYHALSVLNYTHKGKIDVIYIDPPYNTGARDWKYNNDYVDINDQWRHSKWLSMMEKRLKLAKNLLSKQGVLVVTIDDNEFCPLGLLLDEIFPNKERTTVVIKYNPAGTARSGFSRCHEYAIYLLNPGQEIEKKPAPLDERSRNLRRNGNNSNRSDSPSMFYPILIDKAKLKVIGVGEVPDKNFHPKKQTTEHKNHFEIWPLDDENKEKNWYFSRKRVAENGKSELNCRWIKDRLHVFFATSNNSEQKYQTVWTGSEYDAGAYGTSLVKSIVGVDFPFPKSLYAVKDCIKSVVKNKKDATVLDFFAGSGTTAHAVLELNKEDKGNRKFILCTNNENNICTEVCYPRVKNVLKSFDKEAREKLVVNRPGNLKFFKTDFVDAEPTDRNKRRLVDKSTEMLCLKEECFDEAIKGHEFKIFTNGQNKHLGIIYDDDGIEEFKKEAKKLKKKIIVYVFSLDESAREEEFQDIHTLVELKPIPAVILNVYKRIFK